MDDRLIQNIEHYGALLMLPYDVAKIIEMSADYLINEINDEHSHIGRAYNSGWLKTEVRIRQQVFGMPEDTEDIEAVLTTDVELSEFQFKDLTEFKAKLNYQLNA